MRSRPKSAFNLKRTGSIKKRPMTGGMMKRSLHKKDIEELKEFKNYDIQKKLD